MLNSARDAITEFLFLEKPASKADLIFVFGNDWLATMDSVAEMYHAGASANVLISGHSANKERAISEAERFAAKGLELGISKSAFILEHRATNTKENLEFSIPLIEEKIGLRTIRSILFVCKTFHTRRVLMTAKKFLPPHIEYFFLPMIDERNIQRDNWWLDHDRFERVVMELRRIADYTLKGDLSLT